MHNDLYFSIADLGLRIEFLDITDGRPYINSYAPFQVVPDSLPIVMHARISNTLVTKEAEGTFIGKFDIVGNDYIVYALSNEGYKIIICNVEKEPVVAFTTSADFSAVAISAFGDIEDQMFGIKNALMIGFSFASTPYNCLMLHSSVIAYEEKAYLFLGVSGMGKSTHSDLWCRYVPDTFILNDDNPVLRIVDEEVRIYGTPWSGKRNFYRQIYLPIGAFVDLEQAPVNEIELKKMLEAFSIIFSSTASMIWDKRTFKKISSIISEVVERTPVYHLKNRPECEAVVLSYENSTGKKFKDEWKKR